MASATSRGRNEYREALEKALRDDPKPNPRREYAADLYSILWLVEAVQTPEGLERIGIKEEDVPKAAKILPIFLNKDDAKIAIVAAERKLWAEYGADSPNEKAIEAIRRDRMMALLAFPAAADLSESLMPLEGDGTTIQRWRARRITYTALLRATEGPAVPKKIKTSDLLSPFDGKPIRYRFDGKAITLDVGRPPSPDGPTTLTIPVQNGRLVTLGSS